MALLRTLKLLLLIVTLAVFVACDQQHSKESEAKPIVPASEQDAEAASRASGDGASTQGVEHAKSMHGEEGPAHQDHDSKHGGLFFMALDNKHHLEGVLDAPGIFRVFLYDDHTQPVNGAELRQAKMTVI